MGTERSQLALDAAFDSLYAAGFAFDSLTTEIGYTGATDEGTGVASIAIFQDTDRDYRFRTDYRIELDRQELLVDDVALRFDTTSWASTQPGTVSWGEGGIEVETLELQSRNGGRIFVDGSLPTEGSADLELAIERLPIQDVLALLQDTAQASGLLSFRADVDGLATAPTIVGQTALTDAAVGGTSIPSLRATFGYADTELELQAELLQGADRLLVADARLPVNLALQGVEGNGCWTGRWRRQCASTRSRSSRSRNLPTPSATCGGECAETSTLPEPSRSRMWTGCWTSISVHSP